jgi:hypothetical protein
VEKIGFSTGRVFNSDPVTISKDGPSVLIVELSYLQDSGPATIQRRMPANLLTQKLKVPTAQQLSHTTDQLPTRWRHRGFWQLTDVVKVQ